MFLFVFGSICVWAMYMFVFEVLYIRECVLMSVSVVVCVCVFRHVHLCMYLGVHV